MERRSGDVFGNSWGERDAEELRILLDRAVSASYNGIVITDPSLPDNPIIYANPSFARTTGYDFDEAIGHNCRFLQREDNEQPALDELREAINEGREGRVVLRNYRKSGEMFWNELYVSPVLGDDGEVTHFIGVQHDITERKQAEEERDLLLAREQLAKAEAVAAKRRLSFLIEADNVLLSSVGFFERLRDTARLAVPALSDWCLVDIVEEGEVIQAAASHAEEGKQALLRELQRHRSFGDDSNGVAARVLRSGKPEMVSGGQAEIIEDLASNEESERLLRELGVSSLVSVPLLARGRALGVLTLVSSNPERLYGKEDLALAESLAHRCALAVDNAGMYRERSRIARTLQRSLLPRLPEVDEVDVGVEYLPLGEETEIGGDFYDLIRIPNDSLIAVVGDVCGKGPDAAAVAALARHTIQAVVMNEDSPSRILALLNEAMLRQLDDLKFSTIACARLAKASGAEGEFDLTIARGGHPAPLLLRSDGKIEKVEVPGKVLGVFDDPGLEEKEVRLRPGDAAIFYTDGITEARAPDGSLFGENRLLELVHSCAALDAAGMAECLKDTVHKFEDGTPRDDLAVLVLKVP